jgi:hypothetical protein
MEARFRMSQAIPVENSCGYCGASLHEGARFCRQCGNPIPTKEVGSVTESTTRLLGQSTGPQHPPSTEFQQGSPVYRPAATVPTPPTTITQGLQRRPPRYRTPLIIFCLTVVFLFVLGLAVAVRVLRHSPLMRHPVTPVQVAPPAPPSVPDVTGPPAGVAGNKFIYPGAKVNLQSKSDNGVTLQLQTTDSVDKVVAWYTAKLKPTKTVNLPGGVVSIMEGENGKAVITGSDEGTSIIFKGGDE